MANNCLYSMKVIGEKNSIEDFIKMMKWKNEYKEDGIGRVYSCSVYESEDIKDTDKVAYYMEGDCAWSVCAAMIETEQRSLINESIRLGLVIEIYSQELGCEFEEHYIINEGEIVLEKQTDIFSIYDEEDKREVAERLGITIDEVEAGMDDCHYGGFADWEFTI